MAFVSSVRRARREASPQAGGFDVEIYLIPVLLLLLLQQPPTRPVLGVEGAGVQAENCHLMVVMLVLSRVCICFRTLLLPHIPLISFLCP